MRLCVEMMSSALVTVKEVNAMVTCDEGNAKLAISEIQCEPKNAQRTGNLWWWQRDGNLC